MFYINFVVFLRKHFIKRKEGEERFLKRVKVLKKERFLFPARWRRRLRLAATAPKSHSGGSFLRRRRREVGREERK